MEPCSASDKYPYAYSSEITGDASCGYFAGGALSIADIAVTTCFLQAQYGDFAVSNKYPKLGYLAAAFASPS